MKNIPTIHTSTHSLKSILKRFHFTLFFIFVAGCLAVAVVLISNTLEKTALSDGYTSPINAGSIDQNTLDRIKSLHTSGEPVPGPDLQSGRINPFGE